MATKIISKARKSQMSLGKVQICQWSESKVKGQNVGRTASGQPLTEQYGKSLYEEAQSCFLASPARSGFG